MTKQKEGQMKLYSCLTTCKKSTEIAEWNTVNLEVTEPLYLYLCWHIATQKQATLFLVTLTFSCLCYPHLRPPQGACVLCEWKVPVWGGERERTGEVSSVELDEELHRSRKIGVPGGFSR